MTSVYRSRALWTGVVGLIGIIYELIQIIAENRAPPGLPAGSSPFPSTLLGLIFSGFLTIAGSLVIFSWIDSTIRVSFDLDFLHRDSLHWKRFRRYAWAVVVVGAFGSAASTTWWEYAVSVAALGLPVAYSALVLIASGLRVRYPAMRAHMKWIGLLVAALLLELATSTISFYLNFPLVLFAYFLYRAATSLSTTSATLVEAVA
jgi:hypothetical protein